MYWYNRRYNAICVVLNTSQCKEAQSLAGKKRKKIVPYKKPRNINIGVVMFGVVFVYLCICVVSYITKESISIYEVVQGSLDQDNIFTGIAIRDEKIVTTDTAGVVSYYVREGTKAAVGDIVYSVDETGHSSELIDNSNGEYDLTNDNLIDLRDRISTFKLGMKTDGFEDVYDFKYDMSNIVLDYMNENLMTALSKNLIDENGNSLYHIVKTPDSGIILYSYDGKENLTADSVTSADFNTDNYVKTSIKTNSTLTANSPAYKIISNENWSILFELNESQKDALASDDVVKIRFLKNNVSVTCGFSIIQNGDTFFGKVDLNKYMINFISDRYVQIEVRKDHKEGLKIPVSSVVQQDFYKIPKEYATMGGNSSDISFIKNEATDDGQALATLVTPAIFKSDDTYYYVSKNDFNAGDVLKKADTGDTFAIGETQSIQGVFCVNKGYSIFRQIEIIDSNDKYYIISIDTQYGISQYDHIVLDGTKVKQNEVIY